MNDFIGNFIKAKREFSHGFSRHDPSPLFRRAFTLKKTGKATLYACGLGYGRYYINGVEAEGDLFTAPAASYDKLIWYNAFDVSDLLHDGENVIAVALGNGFFNESFDSHWGNNKAEWRDNPKFALSLVADGEIVLTSDETFRCTTDSFITFNQLRSGERFDARLYDPRWTSADFDDSGWGFAVADHSLDNVEKALCTCPPIVESEVLDFVEAIATDDGYTLDFGKNISGYVRFHDRHAVSGDEITFTHAEEIYADGRLRLNNLDILYPSVDFQTDRFVSCGKPIVWSPLFTYHGFRYVHVTGLRRKPEKGEIRAVFVCQDVPATSGFRCSDPLLDKIFAAGILSTRSNMFYALTDCPTREKFGWTNDAQASAEQTLIDFDIKGLYEKWMRDYCAVMKDDGSVPAIVPSHGYGYAQGPVADGALFEIPYMVYLYTGDPSLLVRTLPYMKRYYEFFVTESDEYWLGDWDGYKNNVDDKNFIREFYTVKFCRILKLACRLVGENPARYERDLSETEDKIRSVRLTPSGGSVVRNQTVVSMLLSLKIGNADVLVGQLKNLIDEKGGHLDCGMLGTQYLYDALSENGAEDYAYKVITARGIPGFRAWFERGATTLWETWRDNFTDSKNHHMFSNVLAWFFKALLGIRVREDGAGYKKVDFTPRFVSALDYCRGYVTSPQGRIFAEWKRTDGAIEYTIALPAGVEGNYDGVKLKEGRNTFTVKEAKNEAI